MARGVAEAWPPGLFDELASEVFRYQFDWNPTFRRFCEGRGVGPDVASHTEVPPVPVAAFKALDLVSGPGGAVDRVFLTSGTTRGEATRGRHFVPSLDLYRSSLMPPFEAHVLSGAERFRFVSLVPSPTELPESSLSFMVGAAAERHASDVRWLVDADGHLDTLGLADALARADASCEPVLLLGTGFAFVHALERSGPGLGPLPAGSRIMETGGFKGRVRAVPKADLYRRLSDRTGVPRERIINEYGMTELLSQLYEPVLSDGPAGVDRHRPPPWLAVHALDPGSLEPLPEGEEGLLAFFDLANLGSVCHVLTEDVGAVIEGHVHLVGRVEGAEPRGCSRAMDELMSRGASA